MSLRGHLGWAARSHDVREVIEAFAAHAEADDLNLTVIGSDIPTIALMDRV
jgi:hypothetical protein